MELGVRMRNSNEMHSNDNAGPEANSVPQCLHLIQLINKLAIEVTM